MEPKQPVKGGVEIGIDDAYVYLVFFEDDVQKNVLQIDINGARNIALKILELTTTEEDKN